MSPSLVESPLEMARIVMFQVFNSLWSDDGREVVALTSSHEYVRVRARMCALRFIDAFYNNIVFMFRLTQV